MMKKIQMSAVIVLAVGIAGYSIVQYGIIGLDRAGFILQKVSLGEVISSMWKWMLAVHIVTSIFALVLGPFLLMNRNKQKDKLHKQLGYLYTAGVTGGGLSGLYLAYYATGGVIAQTGFGMLAFLWLITVFLAIRAAAQRKIAQHRHWIMINYSLTFAAVTLRIWLGIFMLLFGPSLYEVYYPYIAWLCWVPNILLLVLYLKRKTTFVY
ncbi:DUF2306 domain-containing protein [Terribacillus sp. 7520-G]|uniref:DUF2306 domain-containing protein n=1 Tax=Terribacillus TaxID=459532 RepID=UPI000BA7CA1A|nr:DUF2306 domain-containing protein [Terribacillus sp. 7520-G]PAD39634.1 hypothetical protein CHH53_05330 [Terribacillus sp. 7520-G]